MSQQLLVDVGTSKSLANRALIVKSFFPDLNIEVNSQCDDVETLKTALEGLLNGDSEFTFLEGGTSFRFFVARASRLSRKVKIKASEKLLSRPHSELYKCLRSLGVKVREESDFIEVEGPWELSKSVEVSCEKSTQFASAILLSSLCLENNFSVKLKDLSHSVSYLEMTTSILRSLGLCEFEKKDSKVFFDSSNSVPKKSSLTLESDWSSAVSVAALAVFSKAITISGLARPSLQSDSLIFEIFEKMGIKQSFENGNWTVFPAKSFSGIQIDLANSPDLFPVLALVCTFADSPSYFSGLKNLQYKESHRIKKVSEILERLGVNFEASDSDFRIVDTLEVGQVESTGKWSFSPDSDHRMAMSAAVARLVGARVTIEDQDVVRKSFPGYWEVYRSLM